MPPSSNSDGTNKLTATWIADYTNGIDDAIQTNFADILSKAIDDEILANILVLSITENLAEFASTSPLNKDQFEHIEECSISFYSEGESRPQQLADIQKKVRWANANRDLCKASYDDRDGWGVTITFYFYKKESVTLMNISI